MRSYHHFSIEEREKILVGIEKGDTVRFIAAQLGRNPSSISRELKRNRNPHAHSNFYTAYGAQRKYQNRRKQFCHRPSQWGKGGAFEEYLVTKLKRHWSPQTIVGRYRLEHPQERVPSFQCIYSAFKTHLLPADLTHDLRRKGRKQNAYKTPRNGKLQVKHKIDQRPEEANERKRLGDWESDSVLGKKNSACLATHVDRCSRYLIAAKLSEHTSVEYLTKTIVAFEQYAQGKLHTLTADRGMEFACYAELEKHFSREGLTVYFADPSAPWQRGTNENTNGLLRQYIPKGSDIALLSEEKIQAIVDELNNRPRKALGWLTPSEVFFAPLPVALD